MEIVVAEPEQVDAGGRYHQSRPGPTCMLWASISGSGYPDRGTWRLTGGRCQGHVALDEGRVVAVFRYADEPEAAYETLEGEWLTDHLYAPRCTAAP